MIRHFSFIIFLLVESVGWAYLLAQHLSLPLSTPYSTRLKFRPFMCLTGSSGTYNAFVGESHNMQVSTYDPYVMRYLYYYYKFINATST